MKNWGHTHVQSANAHIKPAVHPSVAPSFSIAFLWLLYDGAFDLCFHFVSLTFGRWCGCDASRLIAWQSVTFENSKTSIRMDSLKCSTCLFIKVCQEFLLKVCLETLVRVFLYPSITGPRWKNIFLLEISACGFGLQLMWQLSCAILYCDHPIVSNVAVVEIRVWLMWRPGCCVKYWVTRMSIQKVSLVDARKGMLWFYKHVLFLKMKKTLSL